MPRAAGTYTQPIRRCARPPIAAMEVRYTDAPPAPPTIMLNDARWWKRADVQRNFDLALTLRFDPANARRG